MRFLIDELFAAAAAVHLRELGHDAAHVHELGLRAAPDADLAVLARTDWWALVTENVADFAHEEDLVLVCVLKATLPAGGAQARALAELLHVWAAEHPRPYLGQHWPATG